MFSTKHHRFQARAISVREGTPRPPVRRAIRVVGASAVLALVFSLSPELTQAPTRADEPSAQADQLAVRATVPIGPVIGVVPRVEPNLPVARSVERIASAPITADATTARSFQAALDAARYGAEAFGVTFAVVRDGRVVWAGSSGVARDGRTALEPDSPMVIGSVSKTFVAATILQLVEEGRIDLGDSVRSHLPELRQISREITVRQLLNHTSGLADVFNEKTRRGLEDHPEHAWTSQEVLGTLHGPWYAPGEGWAYANTNYYLLGMIVERVTGASLEAELQRRFLDPLELDATRSLAADDPTSQLSPAWATIFWASGAMSSSASDLARWGDALYDHDVARQAVIGTDTGRDMLEVNRDDYGLGVKRIEIGSRTGYGHTGLLNAYTALLLHLPKDDVTIALLVNRTQVDLLSMIRERPAEVGPSLLRLATES